jgi:hypothetical protein
MLPWVPLVFVTVHAGAGWGIVSEFAAGGGRHCQQTNARTDGVATVVAAGGA